jgi:hypothetical protein
MAGGSMAVLPELPDAFLCDAFSMKVMPPVADKQWGLTNGKGFIVYAASTSPIKLNLPGGTFKLNWIDPATGKLLSAEREIQGGQLREIPAVQTPAVLWIQKND